MCLHLQFCSGSLKSEGKARKQKVRITRFSILFALCCLGASKAADSTETEAAKPRLWISNQPSVSAGDLSPFDIGILNLDCRIEEVRRKNKSLLLARVNGWRFRRNSIAAEAAEKLSLAVLSKPGSDDAAADWNSDVWPRFVADGIAEAAISKGFDGIVLEGAGDLALSSSQQSQVRKTISVFREKHPGKLLLLGDPPASLEGIIPDTDGVFVTGGLAESKRGQIKRAVASGKPAYAIEFADDAAQASEAASQLISLGAVPFVTTAAMDGTSLAPLREQPRRALVIYGWNPVEAEKPAAVEADTVMAELLQAPLEWLGFEAEYLNIGKHDPPANAAAKYAAVILDGELDIPLAKELPAARWLADVKARGLPVLFTGSLPFSSEDARRHVAAAFGFRGSLDDCRRLKSAAISLTDPEFMRSEMKMEVRTGGFTDLWAPEGSRLLVSLRGETEDGEAVRFDPVFIAPWGGMWLDPYVVFRGSVDSSLFYGDPHRILAAILPKNQPSPDTTTRDGRRIFYSHIDGDGFSSLSSFRDHPLCGELVRDRILRRFPFPVTVSVIEAEIRSLAEGYDDSLAEKSAETARSIFAMPHIQAASHSFSHPYQWDKGDPNPGIYDEPNMPMKTAANYLRIDPVREIHGSIGYINRSLLPPGKQVELMLWSGNCRPGAAALAACRELGVENMNGGNTIISRLYPGLSGVAPRVMLWDGELQIHAANQNEFMYANGWNGPFYGGFADVIDTFERTELPRRMKPVNVYYHFYSATCLSSLRALEKIHRWCLDQPLHSVTALQFARMTRDAWGTRLYRTGERRWLIACNGDSRTLRLPKSAGIPDLAQCKGITGWIEHGDSIYIHTRGQPLTELALIDGKADPAPPAEAHVRLAASSAEIEFSQHEPLKAVFSVKDLRPVETEFAGLPANAVCDVTINSAASQMTADAAGRLRLSLPASARVTLDATRSRYALVR